MPITKAMQEKEKRFQAYLVDHPVLKHVKRSEAYQAFVMWELQHDDEVLVEMCDGCGENPIDYPSKLCVGCQAYKEHTS
jgi:hypothetical protein